MLVGDTLARWVYENEPTKFAAIELVPETSSDVPETLLGRLNDDGEVEGGIAIPGLASWLSDPSEGTSTVVQGLDETPADERPTTRQVNTVHLAWDVMVGLGTLLFLLSAWYWLSWIFRRDMPRSKLFLRIASVAGVLAVLAMEAGWVVTEVGRQPWVVRDHLKVEDAATTNEGVWITFIAVALIYVALAVTVVLVLRGMSRRFRDQDELVEGDVPYGPRGRPGGSASAEPEGAGPGDATPDPEPVGG
jgi:cytochrome d ubiquinol oxidase subunit I